MLVIEIHLDQHENKNSSTQESNSWEGIQSRPTGEQSKPTLLHQISTLITVWCVTSMSKGQQNKGF